MTDNHVEPAWPDIRQDLADNVVKDLLHDHPTAIAAVCHAANRALCQAFGDNSQLPWDEAPDWQREAAINGVLFAAALPADATPEALHDAWMADKRAHGWVHGPVKDAEKKTHPCLVPYAELPPAQRIKDELFRAIVLALLPSYGKGQ